MTDYIKRSDAAKLLGYIFGVDVVRRLHEVPAADVAEVVHCRDCMHKVQTIANGVVLCSGKHGMLRPTENDFCSYGERREE